VTNEASTSVHGHIETIVEHENETIDLVSPDPSNTIDLCSPIVTAATSPHLAPQ
jgi:hypothetical protein